jgi:coenzyme F420-reducing hydrogenase gamma subunit
MARRPRLAVLKLASCDGCQLTLLDCEDELLALSRRLDIAYFPEASSRMRPGPYEVALVEGSVTTPEDVLRLHRMRRESAVLVAIGACATAGGIQALRNFRTLADTMPSVYPRPEALAVLDTSTPISQHVKVDLELRGCPISKAQLLDAVGALLRGAHPLLPTHPVCVECKRRGLACVAVVDDAACLGPITQAGCGALCPSFSRGCYGCFGPVASPNVRALALRWREKGIAPDDVRRSLHSFTAWAPALRDETGEVRRG